MKSKQSFYVTGKQIDYQGENIQMITYEYQTPTRKLQWEAFSKVRHSTQSNETIQMIEIIPIVYYPQSKKETEIVFISKFSPPLNKITYQFISENIKLKQFKSDNSDNETYNDQFSEIIKNEMKMKFDFEIEKILKVSQPIAHLPSATDEYLRFVSVLIDGEKTNWKNSDEFEMYHIPLKSLESFINEKLENDESVQSRLFCFACNASFLSF